MARAYRTAAATASQPPCPSSAGRGERAGGPGTPIAAVRGSARRRAVGDASTRRAACNETLALNPTSAGSAISSIVLSFRAKGAIVPAGCAAPAAALPLARTSRCARKRGPLVGTHSTASSLNFVSASRSRACRRRTASRGGARRRFTPELGAARVTRERAARTRGGPGDPRTLTRARCMVLSRAHTRTTSRQRFLVSYMPLAPALRALGFFVAARRRADALTPASYASACPRPPAAAAPNRMHQQRPSRQQPSPCALHW